MKTIILLLVISILETTGQVGSSILEHTAFDSNQVNIELAIWFPDSNATIVIPDYDDSTYIQYLQQQLELLKQEQDTIKKEIIQQKLDE